MPVPQWGTGQPGGQLLQDRMQVGSSGSPGENQGVICNMGMGAKETQTTHDPLGPGPSEAPG